jgi:hypothetical protein
LGSNHATNNYQRSREMSSPHQGDFGPVVI